jgi:primosomal protein N' (replication factor Y)
MNAGPDDALPLAVPLPVPPTAPGRVVATPRVTKPRPPKAPATTHPVARVAVDVALPHLDQLFDYLVPEPLSATAVAGARVRVRFAGRLVDGFITERLARTEHGGWLSFLERVVSAEPVLTPEVARLAREVADHWAGTLADVLRLAVPPRHAQVESASPPAPRAGSADGHADHDGREFAAPPAAVPGWARYRSGDALLAALRRGERPRAVWAALPGGGWAGEIAQAVAATVAAGRGALVVVPDGRDAARVEAALTGLLSASHVVALTADLGPAERYRRFLRIERGLARAVVGTRAAAFAPVRDLGLVIIWDDGDDLHAEPRAPYPHARDVLLLRAHLADCAAIVGGHAVTAEGARLLATRWAAPLFAARATVRAAAPLVAVGDDAAATTEPAPPARLPSVAWQAAHDALEARAPVLVQVPRRGYLPALTCARCRVPLRCAECAGPLAADAAGHAPACRWCGRLAAGRRCPNCGDTHFRAAIVGARRTAEELGRAFPGVPVHTSSAQGGVLTDVPAGPSLVIATPGAEPTVRGDVGYGAVVLLDAWALLSRADLRAGEEALRRWTNAAALARPAGRGGRVVIVADAALRPVQALVRWDPAGFAETERRERAELGFPPAVVLAELVGAATAVDELGAAAQLPAGVDRLGPVPLHDARPATALGSDAAPGAGFGPVAGSPDVRLLLRAPRSLAAELAAGLKHAQGTRSAHKQPPVRVRIDPADIG